MSAVQNTLIRGNVLLYAQNQVTETAPADVFCRTSTNMQNAIPIPTGPTFQPSRIFRTEQTRREVHITHRPR